MSKITNDVLTRSGTSGCFIAIPNYPYGNSGRQRVKLNSYNYCNVGVYVLLWICGAVTVYVRRVWSAVKSSSDSNRWKTKLSLAFCDQQKTTSHISYTQKYIRCESPSGHVWRHTKLVQLTLYFVSSDLLTEQHCSRVQWAAAKTDNHACVSQQQSPAADARRANVTSLTTVQHRSVRYKSPHSASKADVQWWAKVN